MNASFFMSKFFKMVIHFHYKMNNLVVSTTLNTSALKISDN